MSVIRDAIKATDWDEVRSSEDLRLSARVGLAKWKIAKAENDRLGDYEFACLLIDISCGMKKAVSDTMLARWRADIEKALGPIPQPAAPGA